MRRYHIDGLDALRTLAILGVTLFHMFPDTVRGGYLGVVLFFVLTGYLLAYTGLQEERAGGFLLTRYFLRRVKRIYPSLCIVLLATAGVYHFLAPAALDGVRPEVQSVLLGYNNWWQIAQDADYFTRIANASPFTHLWFLGIEFQYYLFWPLLFGGYLLLRRVIGTHLALLLFGLLALVSAGLLPYGYAEGMSVTRLYYGTDMRLFSLLLGAVAGLAQAGRQQGLRLPGGHGMAYEAAAAVSFPLLFAVTLWGYLSVDGQAPFLYEGGMLVFSLVFLVMILELGAGVLPFEGLLEHPLLRWFGRRSYGIYLWQYPVIYLFAQRGWAELPYAALGELALILLLTVWSDAMAAALLQRRMPFLGRRLVLTQYVLFLCLALCGFLLMGTGGMALVSAAPTKTAATELSAQLAANAAAQAEENEKASAGAGGDEAAEAAPREADLHGIACIGDSVMLGASPALRQVLPDCYIDAEVSRYVGGGLEAAQRFAAGGRLGHVVILALGTNGPIAGADRYTVQTESLLAYLGSERRIFWVNVYAPHLAWQQTNNDYLAAMPAAHPNVTIIDWYHEVKDHPEWLSKDGIHPNDEGCAAYAALVRRTVAMALARDAAAQD